MASHTNSPNAATLLLARLLFVATPLLVLPVTLLALFYNYAALVLAPQNALRHSVRRSSRFKPQTIVITGVSSSAGLRTARALYQTGHNVIGVDQGNSTLFSPARWSKAVLKLYRIRTNGNEHDFVRDLLDVIMKEKATLWIDCVGPQTAQAQAKHVIEKRSTCKCLTSTVGIAENFRTRYDFLDFAQSLRLPTLETHRVRSRNEIHSILNDSKGKKYVLSGPNGSLTQAERVVFPRRTPSQTYQDVSQLKISQTKPWVLEQHIEGLQKYSTFSIISKGGLRAFAAFSEAKGGVDGLPPTSSLSQAMQQYVADFAARAGSDFSSQVCIDFCVDERATPTGVVQQTLPIGGRLAAHPILTLFAGKKGSIDLTRAYLSFFGSQFNGLASFSGLPHDDQTEVVIVPAGGEGGVYQFDQILFMFVVLPLVQLLTWQISLKDLSRSWLNFTNRIFFWRDALYEFWDPLPAVAMYLIYSRTNLRRWFALSSTDGQVQSLRQQS